MREVLRNRVTGEILRRVTLGNQVRREALRRGGAWAAHADECARRAEAWYGRRPCKGEDLALVFGEVFRTE
jgi:hypothetical protein